MNSTNRDDATPSPAMPDEYDRLLGVLDGLPDLTRTKPSTITVTPPLGIGGSRTFVVQTLRQRFEDTPSQDTIFLQVVGANGSTRIAVPYQVADAIARQREALTTVSRRRAGKARAAADKAAGKLPGFMRGKRKAKK